MKKFLIVLLSLVLVLAFASCAKTCTDHVDADGDRVCDNCGAKIPCTDHVDANYDGVCDNEGCDKTVAVDVTTYDEYVAAELDTLVVIESYVQGKQSWWDNKATVYLQDEDGAYLAYDMTCSEADYAKLEVGTKIRVVGYKSEWAGEVEIADAYFYILEGDTYVAEPTDLTEMLGSDDLINYQNVYASFTGLSVKSISYRNDGGDDIYLTLTDGENDYAFCVEVYLTGTDSDVYTTVATLEEGDEVYVEGFLYWYEGMNPHVTAIEKVITHEEYVALDNDSYVVIESYVQAMQSWWDNKATLYLQGEDGAYFVYDAAITEEQYNSITPGTKVLVRGYKGEWAGEVEVVDATVTVLGYADTYVAEAQDLTALLGTDGMLGHQNELALFTDMTVTAISYKNEGGDDIYVTFSKEGVEYDFCVERYLTAPDSDLYKLFSQGTVTVNDVVDVVCFVYWYEGMNPHIVGIVNVNE